MKNEKLEAIKKKIKPYVIPCAAAAGTLMTIALAIQTSRLAHYENGEWTGPLTPEQRECAAGENAMYCIKIKNGEVIGTIGTVLIEE